MSFETAHLFLVRHGEPEYYTQGLSQPGKFDAEEAAQELASLPAGLGRVMILSSEVTYDRQTATIISDAIATKHPESQLAIVEDLRLSRLERYPGSAGQLRSALDGLLVDHSTMPETEQTPDTIILVTDAPLMAVADGKPAYSLGDYSYGGPGTIVEHTGNLVAPVLPVAMRLTA